MDAAFIAPNFIHCTCKLCFRIVHDRLDTFRKPCAAQHLSTCFLLLRQSGRSPFKRWLHGVPRFTDPAALPCADHMSPSKAPRFFPPRLTSHDGFFRASRALCFESAGKEGLRSACPDGSKVFLPSRHSSIPSPSPQLLKPLPARSHARTRGCAPASDTWLSPALGTSVSASDYGPILPRFTDPALVRDAFLPSFPSPREAGSLSREDGDIS